CDERCPDIPERIRKNAIFRWHPLTRDRDPTVELAERISGILSDAYKSAMVKPAVSVANRVEIEFRWNLDPYVTPDGSVLLRIERDVARANVWLLSMCVTGNMHRGAARSLAIRVHRGLKAHPELESIRWCSDEEVHVDEIDWAEKPF